MEWISVKNKQPKKSGRYLAVNDGYVQELEFEMRGIHFDWKEWLNEWDGYEVVTKDVTHWMPLPEPPKK